MWKELFQDFLALGFAVFILLAAVYSLTFHPACAASVMDIAHYKGFDKDYSDLDESFYDFVILSAIEKPEQYDLAKYIDEPKHDFRTLAGVREYNTIVNEAFQYDSNFLNIWYAERPMEFVALHTGDCKSYAVFKFHLLKQLGYKNVKIISVAFPDGGGGMAGHVVTLLDDIWVLDINYPYFYPYAYLRANNGVYRSFDETGVKRVIHDGY